MTDHFSHGYMDDNRSEIRLIRSIFELERGAPAFLHKLVQDVCCASAARLDHDEIRVGDRKGDTSSCTEPPLH